MTLSAIPMMRAASLGVKCGVGSSLLNMTKIPLFSWMVLLARVTNPLLYKETYR
jgi:hypothetical protein